MNGKKIHERVRKVQEGSNYGTIKIERLGNAKAPNFSGFTIKKMYMDKLFGNSH